MIDKTVGPMFPDPGKLDTAVQAAISSSSGKPYSVQVSEKTASTIECFHAKHEVTKQRWLSRGVLSCQSDPDGFREIVETIDEIGSEACPAKVVAIGQAGFVFGGIMAADAEAGFVPIHKTGELTGPSMSVDHDGKKLEMPAGAIQPGDSVTIVSEDLRTAATMLAAIDLIKRAGGEVDAIVVFLDYEAEGGHKLLEDAGYDVISFYSV